MAVISFGRGAPAPECLPVDELADCARAALARDGVAVLSYGPGRGYGPLPEWLAERPGGEHVAYSSSFSKTVAPGVRVGYFVLPPELAAATEAAAVSTYISPPFLTQATVHEFIARGRFEPNLARVRGLLKARRDAMLEALERGFPEGARWSRPEGGYFLWLDLPGGVQTADLEGPAAEAGVAFVKGADFYPAGGGGGEGALRLAYSFVSP